MTDPDDPIAFIEGHLGKPPVELAPYQKEIIRAMYRGDRVILHMPYHTGRTRWLRELVEKYREIMHA